MCPCAVVVNAAIAVAICHNVQLCARCSAIMLLNEIGIKTFQRNCLRFCFDFFYFFYFFVFGSELVIIFIFCLWFFRVFCTLYVRVMIEKEERRLDSGCKWLLILFSFTIICFLCGTIDEEFQLIQMLNI